MRKALIYECKKQESEMDLLAKILEAGVVGCGGAGFPTHVKLNGKPEYFIINGVECEPMLRTDRYIMVNFAEKIVETADLIADTIGADHEVIAVKGHYEEEIAALEAAVAAKGSRLRIHRMDSFYPAGDEQTIVYEVTGRVVPPSGIPMDVGAVVDNAATILAIADAIRGVPFTHKYLTVTGEVADPTVIHVPIGTSFRECIRLAGDVLTENYIVVAGGPMMGKAMDSETAMEAVVTKTTSGILILPGDSRIADHFRTNIRRMLNRAKSACIQCSFCTQLCPRNLLGHPLEPHRIMRTMAMCGDIRDVLDKKVIQNAAICCECGICEVYACPMGLAPRTINGMLKKELSAAGIRYQKENCEWTAHEMRPYRKAPSSRVASRVGVGKYQEYEIRTCRDYEPTEVRIPLQMNIGAPAVPIVCEGDSVQKGARIAACPEGKLGTNICTGIGGVVHLEKDAVIIKA